MALLLVGEGQVIAADGAGAHMEDLGVLVELAEGLAHGNSLLSALGLTFRGKQVYFSLLL